MAANASVKKRGPSSSALSTFLGLNEPRCFAFWRDVIAEFTCAFLLLTILCAAVPTWKDKVNPEPMFDHTILVALAAGLGVFVLIETFAPFGGANLTPTVTLALLVSRKVSLTRALIYFLAHFTGSLAGAAFIYLVTPGEYRGILAAAVPKVAPWQAVFVEIWLIAFVILVVLGNINHKRKNVCLPGLSIGCSVTVAVLMGGKYTGAGLSPAIPFASAVVTRTWTHHWVYWVGPLIGSTLAALFYTHFLDRIEYKPKVEIRADEEDGEM